MNYEKYEKWKNAQELYAAGFRLEALDHFESLYPILEKDPEFLISYADILFRDGDPVKALPLYEAAAAKRTQNTLMASLGQCYHQLNELTKADSAYQQAVYLVPNRFSTRQNLFNFYCQTKQITKAIQWGQSILALPVKIPSQQVEFIKKNVKERLNQLLQAKQDQTACISL